MSLKKLKKEPKFIWGGLHPFFYHPFVFQFIPDLIGKVILDCGCGKGIWAYLIRVTRDLTKAKIIGVDLNKNYLNFCIKHNIYDKVIDHSITKLPFDNKSIDLLISSEVIEHLSKEDGMKFLGEVERVCRGRVIITTPNIFFDTFEEGEEDKHRSLWKIDDFKKIGYKIYGVGLKIKIDRSDRLYRIKQSLSLALTPLAYVFPSISANLICVKDY